ncbi:MAG: hypothetical protein Q9174_002304 [Haloplaca sp. 1 TL-2023]
MGLSAPRKRAKLSHDPNNTAWTRSSSNFGQKVLLSQGWTPGTVLGASSASYATGPANLSHVKAVSRSDNIGLGATKRLQTDDPTTGLGGLEHLLCRLNGKSQQELQTEQKNREDTSRIMYADRRWGFGNFVIAGFLVGDKIQSTGDESLSGALHTPISQKKSPQVWENDGKGSRKVENARGSGSLLSKVPRTGDLDVLRLQSIVHPRPQPHMDDIVSKTKHLRKNEDVSGKSQRRNDKVQREARRRARKKKRAAAKVWKIERQERAEAFEQNERTVEVVPRNIGAAQGQCRHAVRSIKYKKLSSMDPKALNEILMIRA